MKTLVLNWTTAGWRFQNTEIFAKDFVEKWKIMQDIQLKNLDEFFNIEEARNKWLDLIGEIFGVTRDYVRMRGDAFVLDADQLDTPLTPLDGHEGEILDPLYRILIKLKTASTRKLFTMKNIRDVVYDILGEDSVTVEFIENVEPYSENFKAQYFQLHLYFKSASIGKLFVYLINIFTNLFDKPMGVSYEIFCHYDEEE